MSNSTRIWVARTDKSASTLFGVFSTLEKAQAWAAEMGTSSKPEAYDVPSRLAVGDPCHIVATLYAGGGAEVDGVYAMRMSADSVTEGMADTKVFNALVE